MVKIKKKNVIIDDDNNNKRKEKLAEDSGTFFDINEYVDTNLFMCF